MTDSTTSVAPDVFHESGQVKQRQKDVEFLSFGQMWSFREFTDFNIWRAAGSEFLGTLLLVFLSCSGSAVIHNIKFTDPSLVAALETIVILTLLITATGPNSGGQLNPLLTLATLFTQAMSVPKAFLYIVSQIVGATIGGLLIRTLVANDLATQNNLGGCNFDSSKYSVPSAFLAEVVFSFTALFILYIFALDPKKSKEFGLLTTAFLVSLTLASIGFLSSGLHDGWNGAAVNTAVCFGSSVAIEDFSDHWVFWIGHLTAAIIYAVSYKIIQPYNKPKTRLYIVEEGGMYHSAQK